MRRALAALAAITGCSTPPATQAPPVVEQTVVRTASGASITLPIDVPIEHHADGTRQSFRADDGRVWSVQTLSRSPTADGGDLASIAIALCNRVELGEVRGEFTHRACQFAGADAQCIDGWQQTSAGERVARRGALVRLGEEVLWISIASTETDGRLEHLADTLVNDTRLEAAR